MKVMVVGGGSAGHVIPALVVIKRLQAAGDEVVFVGTHSGLEENLVAPAGVTFAAISAGKLRRYFSWQNFTDVFRIFAGVLQAFLLVGRHKPDVVFSKGGFVSFPVAFAAWLRRVPIVAHESDLTPGLANRLVLPFAATLCVSFAHTVVKSSRLRVVHSGTPLREEILQGDASRGRVALGVGDDKPLLVVTGGSLGADHLNRVVRSALVELTKRFYVFHVCGVGKTVEDAAADAKDYMQREYVSEGWGDILAAADVVLSRAGANALFELLALGKLNLLVPLPAAASRGDQLDNAAYAKRLGVSGVLPEEQLSADTLVAELDKLMAAQASYRSALQGLEFPDAAEIIVHELNRITA